eukprot:TRINITY_DN9647_c0_g1_i1.p1 TRINITY_DN9647_c0_g1~~TRINITY_DN9647_c0_g1_i1.p1  ORF type:complete len:220 (-),score=45.18 TRINITY_DN9647_c0_g1_i1:1033-1692(-)
MDGTLMANIDMDQVLPADFWETSLPAYVAPMNEVDHELPEPLTDPCTPTMLGDEHSDMLCIDQYRLDAFTASVLDSSLKSIGPAETAKLGLVPALESKFQTKRKATSSADLNKQTTKTRRRGTSEQEICDRHERRLQRNRISAQLSRQRKKHFVADLETQVHELGDAKKNLETMVAELLYENQLLRDQISNKSASTAAAQPHSQAAAGLPATAAAAPAV